MNEFNIKNGFISNSNSRVSGTLTATTLNVQTLGGGTSIANVGIDSSGNLVTGTSGGGGTFTGGTVTGSTTFTNGLTANTFSATTIYGINLTVTGGTQSLFSGSSSSELVKIIQNGPGDAFVVEDISNGDASHFVINASGNTAIGLTQPLGNDKLTVSGDTSIYGAFKATTVSATTYYNLPTDIYTTGGTRTNDTLVFTNTTGGTFTVTGTTPSLQEVYTASTAPRITTNNTLGSFRLRGGTGSDSDNNFIIENNTGDVTSYWTANGDLVLPTISATTYYNLPLDIRVTGGTYNQLTGIATFTNNSGGTFSLSGFSTGGGTSFTGGTVTGPTSFINGLSANTISATTITTPSLITPQLNLTNGLTANTFVISGVPTTNTTDTNVLVRNQTNGNLEQRSINSLTNVVNLVTVGLTGSTGVNYNSIKTAVDSITGATSANTYVVKVGPGVFYEDTITMKSYVDVIGASETNTIIQANNPNATLILGADQSMISDVQIQGCTGTSVAAVVYSSSTTPQLNAIFYVENVRFGANYTHAKTVGTGGGNCIMQCSNVKYGGYPFTLGFYVTNDGSGVGRMQLRNVTSTNGGVTTTTGLIFAKADQPSCAFIVNGCLLTKATGAAAGTGFWVENGGSLRLTGVNFQRWETGIYAPQTGSAPSIEAIALNFENCTTDVNIIHSGATGKIQGTDNYSKTSINIDASLYEVNQDPRIITVAKKGGDFSSIKSAVDSITGSSISNRFLVSVGPGKYSEGLIDLSNKPYVSVEGSNIITTQIVPSGNTQHIIKLGQYNEVSFLSLSGAPSGYAGIYVYDAGDYAQAHKLSFNDCDINVWVESNTKDTIFYGEYLDFNGQYSYGTKTIGNNGFVSLANMENYYNFATGTGVTICNYAQGSGATINVFVGDNSSNGVSGSTAFLIQDGAKLNATTLTIDGFTYGVRNPNVGLPCRFDIDNASIVDGQWDLYIENPSTFATFGGSSSHQKIYSNSPDVYWSFLDIDDGEYDITRKISVTFQDGSHTDLSTLVFGGGTMGLISGGTLTTVSGTTVQTANGFGYLEKSDNSGVVRRIDWNASQITLSANTNNYLYFNESSIFSNSGTLPSTVNNIVLGRVVTDSTSVRFIDLSPVNANHTSNRYASLFREALGSIYAFGSIVTENATKFHLDVTAGEYYYSSSEYLPSGGTNISFTQYYRDGLGGWNTSATTVVNNTYFDGNGSLSALTSSYYTKHTLYTVGDGSYEKYMLVLGQNQYATLIETEDALLATPPSFFSDSVTQLANIYVKQGFSGITQIEDIRPVIGFKAGGVNASSLHANLLGLSSDDHTQYLLADGGRNMSGSLNMGTNNITNVGTVDGVTVSAHASRHLPNGSDPLTTSTPISVSTSNLEGSANSFARSDHQHTIGSNVINDSNISAHTSTKITIVNKTLLNPNIVYSDQINSGITATTISSGIISATTLTANSTSLVSMNATTISATTLSGSTIYGDGSNIANIPIPYGIIAAISIGNYLT